MTYSEAAHILGIQGYITPKLTKKAYLKLAKRYHPDMDSTGGEMMKKINNAFATLQNYTGTIEGINNLTTYTFSNSKNKTKNLSKKQLKGNQFNIYEWITMVITMLAMIFGIIYGAAHINAQFPIYFNHISILIMMISIWYVVSEIGCITSVLSILFGSILFRILVELAQRYIISS